MLLISFALPARFFPVPIAVWQRETSWYHVILILDIIDVNLKWLLNKLHIIKTVATRPPA